MAKFFNKSILVFLLAVVLVVKASHDKNHGHNHKDDDDDEKSHSVKKTTIKITAHGDTASDHDSESSDGTAANGNKDANPFLELMDEHNSNKTVKTKDFFEKLSLVMKAYASKQIEPELRGMLMHIVDFVLDYIGKNKPQDIEKLNAFIQESAKVTSKAEAKVSKNSKSC